MSKIKGMENISDADINEELRKGAKFVIYQYAVSALIVSFKRPSDIYFIRSGQSAIVPGLKYSLLSLVVGWWGIPWGIIYTPWVIASNFGGGIDITHSVVSQMRNPEQRLPEAA